MCAYESLDDLPCPLQRYADCRVPYRPWPGSSQQRRDRRVNIDKYVHHWVSCCTSFNQSSELLRQNSTYYNFSICSIFYIIVINNILLRSPAIALANSEDRRPLYFADVFHFFPEADFSTFFYRHFRNFATWRDSGFNRTFAIGLPLKCPLKQMTGKTPNFADCRTGQQQI